MSTATPRILLTDAAVKRELSRAKQAAHRARQQSRRPSCLDRPASKTFRYQYETPRVNGARGAPSSSGSASTPTTAQTTHAPRRSPSKPRASAANTCGPSSKCHRPSCTFGEAFEQYKAAISKEGKSPRTIADYQDKFDRHLAPWHTSRWRRSRARRSPASTRRSPNAPGRRARPNRLRQVCRQWLDAWRARCGISPRTSSRHQACPNAIRSARASCITEERARESGMGAEDLRLVGTVTATAESDPPRDASVHALSGLASTRRPHRALDNLD